MHRKDCPDVVDLIRRIQSMENKLSESKRIAENLVARRSAILAKTSEMLCTNFDSTKHLLSMTDLASSDVEDGLIAKDSLLKAVTVSL